MPHSRDNDDSCPDPDILAELRGGRYGYDFARALVGVGKQAPNRQRTLGLLLGVEPANRLSPEDAREAFSANLIVIGERRHDPPAERPASGDHPVESQVSVDRVRGLTATATISCP